jgi:hypothetical protein
MACLVQGDSVLKQHSDLVRPHVDSFDYFLDEGLKAVVDAVEPVEVSRRFAFAGGCPASERAPASCRCSIPQPGRCIASGLRAQVSDGPRGETVQWWISDCTPATPESR